jgi:hypothetical protein
VVELFYMDWKTYDYMHLLKSTEVYTMEWILLYVKWK